MQNNLSKSEAKIAILHFLSESEDPKSPREISEELGIRMFNVTSSLNESMREEPKLIDISDKDGYGSRYEFIGDENQLDPLPESLQMLLSSANKDPSTEKEEKDQFGQNEESFHNVINEDDNLSSNEYRVIKSVINGTKKASSAISEETSIKLDKIEQIIKKLEEKGFVEKDESFSEDFDESIVLITQKGKIFFEDKDLEALINNQELKEESQKGKGNTGDEVKEQVIEISHDESPVYEIPDFENPPESSPASRGNPGKNRDAAKMQAYTLACLKEKGVSVKSNISKAVSSFMKEFGRNSVSDQIDEFEELGLINAQLKGKRTFYSINEEGEKALDLLVYGKIKDASNISISRKNKQENDTQKAVDKNQDPKMESRAENQQDPKKKSSTSDQSFTEDFSDKGGLKKEDNKDISLEKPTKEKENTADQATLKEKEFELMRELDFILSTEESEEKREQIRSLFMRLIGQIRGLKEMNASLSSNLRNNIDIIEKYLK